MTERVHPPLFVRPEAREGREDDTRRPEHDRDRTGTVDAHAECAGRLIPRSGCDGHSVLRLPRNLRRLEQARQPLGGKIQCGQDLLAPAPMRDVEQQRPRGVGHVGRALAGQAEAHIVLREENLRDPRVDLGLLSREPEKLWRREACERTVSRQREKPLEPDPGLDLGALGRSSLVVPEDRRAQHPILGVEHDEPVHLAREADARDLRDVQRAQHVPRRPPPVLRILLRPPGSGRREAVATPGASEHLAVGRNGNRLDAGRPDVEADECRHSPPSAP